jgi:uncharacterized protein (TIGR04255 family)
MERKCRYVPLSKQPLVLVLCQVRFSPVRQMAQYIPAIQEDFRRNGYPLEKAGKVQNLLITASGPKVEEQERWEYRTKDETRSVLVAHDSVSLQTTSYTRFEQFADQFRFALDTVLTRTDHNAKADGNTLGVIHRIGLRYVDLIRPGAGQDHRFFLKPGFHGLADEVFDKGTHRLYVQSVGRTMVGKTAGAMIVRVAQGDDGSPLPPDLAVGAPKHEARASAGELVTFVDMDHAVTGSFDADTSLVIEHLFLLHDALVETFHEHVVSKEAIAAWE